MGAWQLATCTVGDSVIVAVGRAVFVLTGLVAVEGASVAVAGIDVTVGVKGPVIGTTAAVVVTGTGEGLSTPGRK